MNDENNSTIKIQAIKIIKKEDELNEREKYSEFSMDKIKEIRKYLLDIQDNSEDWEDPKLSEYDDSDWLIESVEELLSKMKIAKEVINSNRELMKEIRSTGFCRSCLEKISKNEEQKGRCYSNNCKND